MPSLSLKGVFGTLIPFDEVTVSPEVDGILREVKVDMGNLVRKGDVIAVIDETDYNLSLAQAQSALRQAEAGLANIKLEYQRKGTLYREELVTKQ